MRIGFVGKAGSGKTTLADRLVRDHGFVKLSFAAKMKEYFAEILGRPVDKSLDRELLQRFGTDVMRAADRNVWVKWLAKRLHSHMQNGDSIVIDDVRFLNEAQFLRNHGFILVKLAGHCIDVPEHESETELELIMCNHVVYGETLQELFDEFDQLMFDLGVDRKIAS